jgi:microsomal dipeptidase-like Zn-dependent dipeptidase
MLARGYSPEEVDKIWGGNLLRLWAEVEAVAEEN